MELQYIGIDEAYIYPDVEHIAKRVKNTSIEKQRVQHRGWLLENWNIHRGGVCMQKRILLSENIFCEKKFHFCQESTTVSLCLLQQC